MRKDYNWILTFGKRDVKITPVKTVVAYMIAIILDVCKEHGLINMQFSTSNRENGTITEALL